MGLRPYERSESNVFFGRGRDAQFLVDKVFAAKLTLLYSQSGLGKSSLLRALAIPLLEGEEARVLYFDAWSGDNPVAAFKSALVELAKKLGVPDAGAGAPSIAELALLISRFDRRTLVLVLDQFEEFLAAHGQAPDPLRRELAELTRLSDLDIRVLISMRQEFLAALEPFRREILNLFQSTYMLEPLGEEDIRKAIAAPAADFGKPCGDGLVDRLIADLKALPAAGSDKTAAAPPTRQPALADADRVELPMLQLVCGELWTAASRPEQPLSLALYERLGGAAKILNDYVLKVMPHGWRDRVLTATLMRHLAPPSGLKISYSVDDLAEASDLAADRIHRELERLAKLRVLRTRQFQHAERFELQHDAFISIIAPWRDRVLQQRRWRRAALRVIAALTVISMFATLFYLQQGRAELELYANTERPLAALRDVPEADRKKLIEATLDGAAGYLLRRYEGADRLERLKDLLARHQGLQPQLYGIVHAQLDVAQSPPDDWPWTLHYSSHRALDQGLFNLAWLGMARSLVEKGIPVPLRLRLVPNSTYPKRLLGFAGPGAGALRLSSEQAEGDAFILAADMQDDARAFFDRFSGDWHRIEGTEHGEPYYRVPRWSLPVWKVSGSTAIDGSGVPALMLKLALQAQPDQLLTQPAVDFLLARVKLLYPHAVAEAKAARGARLREDFVERVRRGHALSDLPEWLDALGDFSASTPAAEVASAVAAGRDRQRAPMRLSGPRGPAPWIRASSAPDAKAVEDHGENPAQAAEAGADATAPTIHDAHINDAFGEIASWLPAVEAPLRVSVGDQFVETWFPRGEVSARVEERLDALRDEVFRRFGIQLPGVRFQDSGSDAMLGPHDVRVLLLDESAGKPNAPPVATTRPGAGLEQLMQALLARITSQRAKLLGPDVVHLLLEPVDRDLRGWLNGQYSLTDLKRLLRAVLDPGAEQKREGTDLAPELTLRHTDWLLGSLVFWSAAHDPLDLERVSEALRNTQRAGLAPPARDEAADAVADAVRRGIGELQAKRFAPARSAFQRAIAVDRERAIAVFISAYAHSLPSRVAAAIDSACQEPTRGGLDREGRSNVEEWLARATAAEHDRGPRRKRLLCLYASYPPSRVERRGALARELLTQHAALDFPPSEAAWLANEVLKTFDPIRDGAAIGDAAGDWMASAIPRLDEPAAVTAFTTLQDVCQVAGAKNWCWDLLVKLVEARPDGELAIQLAVPLGSRGLASDRDRVRRVLELAEKNADLPGLRAKDRQFRNELVTLARALALQSLGADAARREQAEKALTGLLASQWFAEVAHLYLIDMLLGLARYEPAEQRLHYALQAWPSSADFHVQQFWLDLLRGDRSAAERVAQDVVAVAGQDNEMLFVAALGQILTETGQWEQTARAFLATDHEYVAYVTMLLYGKLLGQEQDDAKELLETRWAAIAPNRANWSARLRGGDRMVWREMLIGYYLGEVPASDIFGPLESDAAFERSELKHLPLPRIGMLCEAYFYDAVLAQARRDPKRMRVRLEQAIATDKRDYHEHKMAKFMLATSAATTAPK